MAIINKSYYNLYNMLEIKEDLDQAKTLISELSNVNEFDLNVGPLLFYALFYQRYRIADLLLQAGADVNFEWRYIQPIFWPILNLKLDVVELLLKYGASVTKPVGKLNAGLVDNISDDTDSLYRMLWEPKTVVQNYLIDPMWLIYYSHRNIVSLVLKYHNYDRGGLELTNNMACLLINNGADVSLVPEEILTHYKEKCGGSYLLSLETRTSDIQRVSSSFPI